MTRPCEVRFALTNGHRQFEPSGPKTLYGAYWCQGESGGAVESFCHVTRLHLRHGQPFARLRRAVKPQSRLRRAEGAGLDRECAVRAIIIVAATYKSHSALFEALWIAIVGSSPAIGAQKSRHNLVFGRSVCGSHHDAVTRIVGEAPGRQAQSAQRHLKPWF